MRLAIASVTPTVVQRHAPATDPTGIAILLEAKAMRLRGRGVNLLEDALASAGTPTELGSVESALILASSVPLVAPRIHRLIILAGRLDERAQMYRGMARVVIKATNLGRWE